uniref:Putative secreted protein n=1 Tax=Anopheles darlingi TaxID=43151 RepID=A0A2M4DKX2_ANODA
MRLVMPIVPLLLPPLLSCPASKPIVLLVPADRECSLKPLPAMDDFWMLLPESAAALLPPPIACALLLWTPLAPPYGSEIFRPPTSMTSLAATTWQSQNER